MGVLVGGKEAFVYAGKLTNSWEIGNLRGIDDSTIGDDRKGEFGHQMKMPKDCGLDGGPTEPRWWSISF
jgi:hypothetical protein